MAATREAASVRPNPDARHRSRSGRCFERAGPNLPSADRAECFCYEVLHVVDFGSRGRPKCFGKIGERLDGAACVDKEVGGFDQLRFAGSGHAVHLSPYRAGFFAYLNKFANSRYAPGTP